MLKKMLTMSNLQQPGQQQKHWKIQMEMKYAITTKAYDQKKSEDRVAVFVRKSILRKTLSKGDITTTPSYYLQPFPERIE